jgi:hypothetical protein
MGAANWGFKLRSVTTHIVLRMIYRNLIGVLSRETCRNLPENGSPYVLADQSAH